jgi:hypothetical protein
VNSGTTATELLKTAKEATNDTSLHVRIRVPGATSKPPFVGL